MYKFVIIYRQVDDPAIVDTFFAETHLTLAEQLPGLRKSEVSRVNRKPGGESRFYMVYELYFDSQIKLETALLSRPGLLMMNALKPWAEKKLITWFYAETFEENHE